MKSAVVAAMLVSLVSSPIHAFAGQHPSSKVSTSDVMEEVANMKPLSNQKQVGARTAIVSKLKSYGTEFEEAYDKAFRIPNSNVSKVTTNGGSYHGTKPEFMLDDLPNTHWETTKNNSADFTNEVVFELENPEVLDRVAF